MSRNELKKRAVRQVGRIVYGREVGNDTAVMEWRLRQTCRQLLADSEKVGKITSLVLGANIVLCGDSGRLEP